MMMKIKLTLLVTLFTASCLFLSSYAQDSNTEVVVGDLAHLHLLPGSPVVSMDWDNQNFMFDEKFRLIDPNLKYLISVEEKVETLPNGEIITNYAYTYTDNAIWDAMWYDKSYDSKGRIINKSTTIYVVNIKYNKDNLVVDSYYGYEDGEPTKIIYKYNEDGHCVYEAHYDIDTTKYDSESICYLPYPSYIIRYTILKVDKYGNWTSRKSTRGTIEERKIIYKAGTAPNHKYFKINIRNILNSNYQRKLSKG